MKYLLIKLEFSYFYLFLLNFKDIAMNDHKYLNTLAHVN